MNWWILSVLLTLAFVYCEFVADYVAMWKCSWPETSTAMSNEVVRAMVLADTHLIGPVRGHWLDRLYREWHMQQAFNAAISLLKPDIVFVLGDLFDEGFFVSHTQFNSYVERFQRIFNVPAHIPLIGAVGNHDVGFHYKMNPYLISRFKTHFNNTGVQLYTFKQVHFVVLNSMAMQDDGCSICERSLRDLRQISEQLNCLKNPKNCKDMHTLEEHKSYSRPVLMQHFPTYRSSDRECREHDAPDVYAFREDWEVLSKESTRLLGELINPRVAFAGHSHHYCMNVNQLGIHEYTAATFNWRNKINPSFLLAEFTSSSHAVSKCNMLEQTTVYNVYYFVVLSLFSILIFVLCRKLLKITHKSVISTKNK